MNIKILLGGFVLLMMSSCSPSFYMPNMHNVAAIEKKGQGNLTAGMISFRAFELQGAYGFTNYLAGQINVVTIGSNVTRYNGGSAFFIEVGPGYFYHITPFLLLDIYPLFGFGNFENHFNPSDEDLHGNISADLIRYGIQPAFNFHYNNFSFSISYRIVNVNYSNIKGDLIHTPDDEEIDQVKFLKEHSSNFRLEPAMTFKFGNDKVKFLFQSVFSSIKPKIEFPSCPSGWAIGFSYTFNTIKSKVEEVPPTKF